MPLKMKQVNITGPHPFTQMETATENRKAAKSPFSQ
jgi:hypothetical protein